MPGDVDPLEEVVDRVNVLPDGDGYVAQDEKRKVQKLVGMEGEPVMCVISENKLPIVVYLNEPQKCCYNNYLKSALSQYLPLVGKEYLEDSDEVAGGRFGDQNLFLVV